VFSFKILSSHFGQFSAEEVMQCSSALTPFFLSALDLRVQVHTVAIFVCKLFTDLAVLIGI